MSARTRQPQIAARLYVDTNGVVYREVTLRHPAFAEPYRHSSPVGAEPAPVLGVVA